MKPKKFKPDIYIYYNLKHKFLKIKSINFSRYANKGQVLYAISFYNHYYIHNVTERDLENYYSWKGIC